MKSTTVGIRYAKALLDLAIEQNVLAKVSEDIKLIDQTIKNSHEFELCIHSPIIKADKKQSIFTELFSGKIHDLTLQFLLLLAGKRRENYLDVIADQFHILYNNHRGVQTAIVTTAVGLDDELRNKVYNVVKESVKSEVELIERIDKNLIGGFVIRLGDTQLDSSVVRTLNNYKRTFLQTK
jgi:F-type H+-transporting ATPase subunit delta